MIPKIIHYVWFGGAPKNGLVSQCMDSWKEYLSDYQLIEWNESNFDINENAYIREAYTQKKWAFISDYVRLKAIYEHGGIYMDTDVQVFKPFDDLLHHGAFTGFELHGTTYRPITAVMGARIHHEWFAELLADYTDAKFDRDFTNTTRITSNLNDRHGIVNDNSKQMFDDVTIYPAEYFCVKSSVSYSVHHFNGSWLPAKSKLRKMVRKVFKI